MKTIVKTYWIGILLILTCIISGETVSFAIGNVNFSKSYKVSTAMSSCSLVSSEKNKQESLSSEVIQYSWMTGIGVSVEPVSEVCFSIQQRIRRVIGDNVFLRNIYLLLSNHANLHNRFKRYFSAKPLHYTVTGSDYYIYTLRRILI